MKSLTGKEELTVIPAIMMGMKLDRKSPAYRRATYAGFNIDEMRIRPSSFYFSGAFALVLELSFTCVCGTREYFIRTIGTEKIELLLMQDSYFTENGWDGALEIEHRGGFSAEHLRGEGYSEEAIKEIRYIYDLEEEVQQLRRDNHVMLCRLGQYEYTPLEV